MRRLASSVLAIAYKETLVMRHDRGLMMTIAVQPFIMCLLFGGALSNVPRNVPWVVLDRSATALSRRLVADIQATGYFVPVRPVESYDEGIRQTLDWMRVN